MANGIETSSDILRRNFQSLGAYLNQKNAQQDELQQALAVAKIKQQLEQEAQQRNLQNTLQIVDRFNGGGGLNLGGMQQIPLQGTQAAEPTPSGAAMSLAGGGIGDVSGQPLGGQGSLLSIPRETQGQALSPFIMQPAFSIDPSSGSSRITFNQVANPEYKQSLKDKEKSVQQEKETSLLKAQAEDTLNTIGEIKKNLKYFGAAGAIPPLPGEYDKVNWEANLNRLKGRLVLDIMTQLKAASKTGSTGFGQLSEKEMQLLQNSATALNKNMRESDALRYLNIIEKSAKDILNPNYNASSGSSNETNSQQISRSGVTSSGVRWSVE